MMNQNALFQIGYGLYMVAVNENGKDNACIVNTVMQVTQNPIRLLVSISNQKYRKTDGFRADGEDTVFRI